MSESALVEELKRLVLENAQLKAALVVTDEIRQMPPVAIGRGWEIEPLVIGVDASELSYSASKTSMMETLLKRGTEALAAELLIRTHDKTRDRSFYMGFVEQPKLGRMFRLGAFLGVVSK